MRQLSISQLKTAIKEIAIRLDLPIIIRGRFGIGKSQGVAQAVEELDSKAAVLALLGSESALAGAMLVDIRLSQYDSVDLRGYPQADRKTGTAIWYPPATLPFIGNDAFPDDKLIVVFFDEVLDAQPAVFAVAQQLVLDRCVGEHVLKSNVRLVLAGNLDSDQGLAKRLPMPLNNRLIHFEAVNPLDSFCSYAQSQGVPPVFIAFWNFRAELVNTYAPKEVRSVVATPRTWFTAVNLWQDQRLGDDLKEAAMIGAIGEGPAMEFAAFNALWKSLVPIKQIVADPLRVPVPEELSLKYATVVHVSGHMSVATVPSLHAYLTRFPVELVVLAWQLATERDPGLFETNEFMDYVKRYRDVYTS